MFCIKKNVKSDDIHNIECCPKFIAGLVIDGMFEVEIPPAATTNTDEDQLNSARTMAIFTHNMKAHAIIVMIRFFSASIICENGGNISNHLSDFFATHAKTLNGYIISAKQKSKIA